MPNKLSREVVPEYRGLAFCAFILAFLSFVVVIGLTFKDRELRALGTANTVAKFTGTASIGNSSATDDGTTFAINTNKFTVLESSGFMTTAANIQFGGGNQVFSGGTPTSNHGSIATGSTNAAGCVTGIGANSDVTITYSTTFATRSFCTATMKNSAGAQVLQIDSNATVLAVSCFDMAGTLANCNDLCWHCIGQ